MGNFDEAFQQTLARQSWAFYGVGMLMIVLRLYARDQKLGMTNYQVDDYLMMFAAALYTTLIVTLNKIAEGGGSNLYTPDLESTFTPEDIRERIYGSKIVIISEQAMLNVIYTIKACMLVMFARLTMGLARDQRIVRYLSIYVAAGWVATEIAFFTACRPFNGYWAVPPPNPQCTTLEHYAIVQGCFNISADVLMLGIPIPLIVRMRLPWRQKIVLMVVFSLGVFVILAALMTKIFNLTDVYSPTYMLWYVREASVAVYVSNLPLIWPLLRVWFPVLRKLTPGAGHTSKSNRGSRWFGRGSRSRRRTIQLADVEAQRKYTGCRSTMTPSSRRVTRVVDGSESGLLPPGEVLCMKGIKEPFTSYEDIEMTMTDLDDTDGDGCEKIEQTKGSRSGARLDGSLDRGNAHYLDAPARVVTKIEPGRRASIHSAECMVVSAEPAGLRDDRPFHGGIQVTTTFGIREEVRTTEQGIRSPRSEQSGSAW